MVLITNKVGKNLNLAGEQVILLSHQSKCGPGKLVNMCELQEIT